MKTSAIKFNGLEIKTDSAIYIVNQAITAMSKEPEKHGLELEAAKEILKRLLSFKGE